MSNKTQLQTNNTQLDALITRVNAAKDTAASLPDAGSGGGSGALEWISLDSLPQTYVVMPPDDSGSELSYYYYEVPEGCIGVVGYHASSEKMCISYKTSYDNGFIETSLVNEMGETILTMEDADGTGTILKIGKSMDYDSLYVLPLYSPT